VNVSLKKGKSLKRNADKFACHLKTILVTSTVRIQFTYQTRLEPLQELLSQQVQNPPYVSMTFKYEWWCYEMEESMENIRILK